MEPSSALEAARRAATRLSAEARQGALALDQFLPIGRAGDPE
jgi:hypothetical protein